MPPVVRVPDTAGGHESFPPTDSLVGSGNTFVNSLPVHRNGDDVVPHGSLSKSKPHTRTAGKGSSNTYANSLEIMRLGDPIDCGGLYLTGSPDTIIN